MTACPRAVATLSADHFVGPGPVFRHFDHPDPTRTSSSNWEGIHHGEQ
jgi:hypothetical protein